MAGTLSDAEAKSIATVLEKVGLLSADDAADKTKTEKDLADNTLEGTRKIVESIKKTGFIGAGTGGVAGIGGGFLQDNHLAVALGVLGIALVVVAWVVSIAWATRADVTARANRATAVLNARGAVAAAMSSAMLAQTPPPAVHDGQHGALLAALDDAAAVVTLKSGRHGHVTDRFIKGERLMFTLEGDPTAHSVGEIADVKVLNN